MWLWWGFNSLAPGRLGSTFELLIFKLKSRIDILTITREITLRRVPKYITVPNGTNPLPEPKLTKLYDAIWCH